MTDTTSFYWFDYETFGTSPIWDRPCQFAGVRTDLELNEIDDPMIIYCRQSMDYLPNPVACKVTGITPQLVNEQGLNEADFIKRIVEQIGQPGTCSLGYNSIRFDDEFTRHTLFRNFHEPYEHEFKDGNSRWDLLDVVRLTRALRPDGINWPLNDEGKPSMRLEHLTAANGIEHGNAHDALSDVRATIGMAKLIREKIPKLFDYAFAKRTKDEVSKMLNTSQSKTCLLISGMIPSSRSHLSVVLPLAPQPGNRNNIIVIDLHQDPSSLLTMSADEIAHQLFTKHTPLVDMDRAASPGPGTQNLAEPSPPDTDADATSRPGLRTVAINKCPVVMPLNTLRPEDAERLDIDMDTIRQHEKSARRLLEADMLEKIKTAMTRAWPDSRPDVEGTLYSGSFLSRADRQRAKAIRESDAATIEAKGAHFDDKRLIELAWRYQAKNYPESLGMQQQARWQEHCHRRLNDTLGDWLTFAEFDKALASTAWDESDAPLKKALASYRLQVEQFTTPLPPEDKIGSSLTPSERA